MSKPKIAVIISSTRPTRFGDKPANWILGHLKARTDASGNRHFGTWVAMQVRLPRWVLPDGSIDPREPGAALWQGMAPVPGLQGLSAVAGAAAGARPNAGERP